MAPDGRFSRTWWRAEARSFFLRTRPWRSALELMRAPRRRPTRCFPPGAQVSGARSKSQLTTLLPGRSAKHRTRQDAFPLTLTLRELYQIDLNRPAHRLATSPAESRRSSFREIPR